mmetsp:Transcript_10389/g.25978  ORF Transcript_10389/g.25978 Transcript_10389/m.25978 type:complete len:90 (+) Transcript_10389:97-366(+)
MPSVSLGLVLADLARPTASSSGGGTGASTGAGAALQARGSGVASGSLAERLLNGDPVAGLLGSAAAICPGSPFGTRSPVQAETRAAEER